MRRIAQEGRLGRNERVKGLTYRTYQICTYQSFLCRGNERTACNTFTFRAELLQSCRRDRHARIQHWLGTPHELEPMLDDKNRVPVRRLTNKLECLFNSRNSNNSGCAACVLGCHRRAASLCRVQVQRTTVTDQREQQEAPSPMSMREGNLKRTNALKQLLSYVYSCVPR